MFPTPNDDQHNHAIDFIFIKLVWANPVVSSVSMINDRHNHSYQLQALLVINDRHNHSYRLEARQLPDKYNKLRRQHDQLERLRVQFKLNSLSGKDAHANNTTQLDVVVLPVDNT